MERLTLPNDKISPTVLQHVASLHRPIIEEIANAVAGDAVVVVGMAQNPFVKKARKLLDEGGMKYTYLEYGSYFSKWKERLAIKLWAGFPTFPMVFVGGTLEGGFTELKKLHEEGKLKPRA